MFPHCDTLAIKGIIGSDVTWEHDDHVVSSGQVLLSVCPNYDPWFLFYSSWSMFDMRVLEELKHANMQANVLVHKQTQKKNHLRLTRYAWWPELFSQHQDGAKSAWVWTWCSLYTHKNLVTHQDTHSCVSICLFTCFEFVFSHFYSLCDS